MISSKLTHILDDEEESNFIIDNEIVKEIAAKLGEFKYDEEVEQVRPQDPSLGTRLRVAKA